jgi:transposase
MGAKRRKFSREFKLEALRLIQEKGYSQLQVARDLEIRPEMLRRWKKQYLEDRAGAFPGEGEMRGEQGELSRLRRENERLREEREILKKALAIFSEPRRGGTR